MAPAHHFVILFLQVRLHSAQMQVGMTQRRSVVLKEREKELLCKLSEISCLISLCSTSSTPPLVTAADPCALSATKPINSNIEESKVGDVVMDMEDDVDMDIDNEEASPATASLNSQPSAPETTTTLTNKPSPPPPNQPNANDLPKPSSNEATRPLHAPSVLSPRPRFPSHSRSRSPPRRRSSRCMPCPNDIAPPRNLRLRPSRPWKPIMSGLFARQTPPTGRDHGHRVCVEHDRHVTRHDLPHAAAPGDCTS